MSETDDNGTLKINGSVEGIIFSNEENGYTICDIGTEDGDLITAVGYLPYLSEGDTVTLYGKWCIIRSTRSFPPIV